MDSGGGEVSEDTWGGEGRAAGGEATEAAGSSQRRHLEVEARRATPGSRPPCRAPRREPYGLHAARVMVSRDVRLSASSFVRLYLPLPAAGDKRLPVVVYFHGGGSYRRCLNDLAAACPPVAVSVDYRLTLEHPLPAAYEDPTAALAWVLSVADPWLAAHGPLSRVFLASDSAGGNICHHLAMCHGLTSQHLPCRLKGIVMIHPWFWGKEPIGGEAADGADDPRMNPTAAGAPGLENLACEKVMVCVAEGDTLRWRGRAYAEAVVRARGGEAAAVELLESEGVGHVFYLFEPGHEKADELLRRIAAFISAK
uniref:Alpha/beta hydrolase fold-3 domain-containing protein n=1 Tax=Oryza barthii TaxID=65489 RepID=A0A0D3ERG1_9ORYZ